MPVILLFAFQNGSEENPIVLNIVTQAESKDEAETVKGVRAALVGPTKDLLRERKLKLFTVFAPITVPLYKAIARGRNGSIVAVSRATSGGRAEPKSQAGGACRSGGAKGYKPQYKEAGAKTHYPDSKSGDKPGAESKQQPEEHGHTSFTSTRAESKDDVPLPKEQKSTQHDYKKTHSGDKAWSKFTPDYKIGSSYWEKNRGYKQSKIDVKPDDYYDEFPEHGMDAKQQTDPDARSTGGWEKVEDATNGTYYYNSATGETSWEKPRDFDGGGGSYKARRRARAKSVRRTGSGRKAGPRKSRKTKKPRGRTRRRRRRRKPGKRRS